MKAYGEKKVAIRITVQTILAFSFLKQDSKSY
jgi:hypothetical protein